MIKLKEILNPKKKLNEGGEKTQLSLMKVEKEINKLETNNDDPDQRQLYKYYNSIKAELSNEILQDAITTGTVNLKARQQLLKYKEYLNNL